MTGLEFFIWTLVGGYVLARRRLFKWQQQRVTTWFCSAFLSLFLGQAIGEYWQLGPKSTSGVTIIVAMLLSDLVAVVIAASRQWTKDPVGTFRRWRDAWLGRGGGGS